MLAWSKIKNRDLARKWHFLSVSQVYGTFPMCIYDHSEHVGYFRCLEAHLSYLWYLPVGLQVQHLSGLFFRYMKLVVGEKRETNMGMLENGRSLLF